HAIHSVAQAGFIAIDRAWPCRMVNLDAIFRLLPVAQEPSVWMCSSPNRECTYSHQRRHVHVCRIHGEHHIQMGNNGQILLKRKLTDHTVHIPKPLLPTFGYTLLFHPTAEYKNSVSLFVKIIH